MAISKETVIDGVRVFLPPPVEVTGRWEGDDEPLRMLAAAWDVLSETDRPMFPAISGKSGVGKTALAIQCAREIFKTPVWIQSCNAEMRPDELLVIEGYDEKKGPVWRGSPLLAAIVKGGAVVLKDAARLSERVWATLFPLLDERNLLEIPKLGLLLEPHPKFRLAVTLNEGSLVWHLPEPVRNRLAPRIKLEMPGLDDLKRILARHKEATDEQLVDKVAAYLKSSPNHVSIRDGQQIMGIAQRLHKRGDITLDKALSLALRAHARPDREASRPAP